MSVVTVLAGKAWKRWTTWCLWTKRHDWGRGQTGTAWIRWDKGYEGRRRSAWRARVTRRSRKL